MDIICRKEQRHKQKSLFSRKSIALLLAAVMLCSTLPSKVSALETTSYEYLCGFSETDESLPESHICEIQSFSGYTPGEALSTYEAAAEETYDEICAALPETLSGTLACASGIIEIPVGWLCGDFGDEAGTYIFRPELKNENCSYTAEDDILTEGIDESELPFIAVVVPEAEGVAPQTETVVVSELKSVSTFTSLPADNIRTISDDKNRVSVSGIIPEDAYLTVDEVSVETAQELLGEADAAVLFAYDIKIMLPGDPEPTEFQPAPESPVTVAITPEAPMEAPVEVVHIAEIADGETEAQPVSVLSATESSIEFEAEGFSVYVVTMGTYTPRVSFSYDDASLYVEYSTDNSTYTPLSGSVSVTAGTTLYFKVTGGSVTVYRDGSSTAMTAGANSVYTIDNIAANTIITIIKDGDRNVSLDVTYGSIVIGGSDGSGGRKYTYYDQVDGAQLTGVHVPGNIYTITGETGSSSNGRGYNVSLIGDGDFDIVLSGVTIYTGEPGGSSIGKGICAPVSTGGVVGNGNINITLVGTNTLENVSANPSDSYAALEKTDSDSTLIINGHGTLYATGGADSAGIGSSDKIGGGTKNITINGGTIFATAGASQGAGIGSGNNAPAVNIRIYGGNITATGVENGAGIGGSGSTNHIAETGEVYIYGGTIFATSNGTGAGIGGGGTGYGSSATGGAGEVHIFGGTITADSIGGGDGGQFGGLANVNISGGKIIVGSNGNIGGGNSAQGSGGGATVTISGGTVMTPRISGGKNGDGTYSDATVSIAAASVNILDRSNINSVTGPNPDSGMADVVYCQPIDIRLLDGFSGSGSVPIQSAKLSDGNTYVLNDVYSDENSMLYFWLPVVYDVTHLNIGGNNYPIAGAAVQTASITHSSSTVGSLLGAVLNYGEPTGYQWRISPNGTDSWSDISGATNSSYTAIADDVGKYIRVIISTESGTVTSGSLRITQIPFAYVRYSSLNVPSTLTAEILNGSGTYSYKWQIAGANSEQYEDIAGETAQTLEVGVDDYGYIGKRVRVIITDGSTPYTASFVVIKAPQISITMPTNTVITANAAGDCSVSGGEFQNTSAVALYLTSVTYTWDTEAAETLFTRWAEAKPIPKLTLAEGNEKSFAYTDSNSIAWNNISANNSIAIDASFTPAWTFSLNGNSLSLVPAVGESVQVATVTYTVGYTLPSA